MIEVKDLTKKYGDFEAVRGVSFEVNKGEIVGLLGPNGAGKTTILKILTCFLFPTTGSVSMDGKNVYEDALEIRRSLGYLPENAPLYTDLNVMEYLDFICDARGMKGDARKRRIEETIGLCGLEKVVYKNIDELSKGYRQRTCLAQAIIHSPEVLILDEPTSGLDPNQILEIRSLIRELGKQTTIILSTHIMQEVEAICGRVLILNEGKFVAQGTTEEIARELKGETVYELVVRTKNPQTLVSSLSAVPGVKKVGKTEDRPDGTIGVHVSTGTGPVEEALFDWAVSQGNKILALSQQKVSLEDIFTKLTREGGRSDV